MHLIRVICEICGFLFLLIDFLMLSASQSLSQSDRTVRQYRAGPGWVPLEPKGRYVGQFNTLQAAIKKRAVRGAHMARQAVLVHGKAVILARDVYAPVIEILYRMVGAVVAKLHLDGACAGRQRQQLVSQANPEYR